MSYHRIRCQSPAHAASLIAYFDGAGLPATVHHNRHGVPTVFTEAPTSVVQAAIASVGEL